MGEDQQKPGNRLHLQTSKRFLLQRSLIKKQLTCAYCLVCSRGGKVGAPTSSLATVVVPPAVGAGEGSGRMNTRGDGVGDGVGEGVGSGRMDTEQTSSLIGHNWRVKPFVSQQVLMSVASSLLQPLMVSTHAPPAPELASQMYLKSRISSSQLQIVSIEEAVIIVTGGTGGGVGGGVVGELVILSAGALRYN